MFTGRVHTTILGLTAKYLCGALPAGLERVASGKGRQADHGALADPLRSEVQIVVHEGLGGGHPDMTSALRGVIAVILDRIL